MARQPVSQPGDLWLFGGLFGEPSLVCSDASNPAAIGRVMDGDRATLLAGF